MEEKEAEGSILRLFTGDLKKKKGLRHCYSSKLQSSSSARFQSWPLSFARSSSSLVRPHSSSAAAAADLVIEEGSRESEIGKSKTRRRSRRDDRDGR